MSLEEMSDEEAKRNKPGERTKKRKEKMLEGQTKMGREVNKKPNS